MPRILNLENRGPLADGTEEDDGEVTKRVPSCCDNRIERTKIVRIIMDAVSLTLSSRNHSNNNDLTINIYFFSVKRSLVL